MQKGQALIEALVALGIILAIMSSIAIIILTSLFNSQFIKQQNIANKYSEQGMEFVRNLQVNNKTLFDDFDDTGFCIDSTGVSILPDTDPFCSSPNVGGSMKRTIDFLQDDASCNTGAAVTNAKLTKVIVTTSWTSAKCGATPYCHSSKVTSCIPYSTGIVP